MLGDRGHTGPDEVRIAAVRSCDCETARGKEGRMICAALDWEKSAHDYVECSAHDGIRAYRLDGLLISVEVTLCESHADYLETRPRGWENLKVVEVKR